MKKIFWAILLFSSLSMNLQAIASLAEESLHLPVQSKKVPSIIPPIALSLTSAATGIIGSFFLYQIGRLIYSAIKDPDCEFYISNDRKYYYNEGFVAMVTVLGFVTPILLGSAIVSGIYAVRKAKAIHQAKKQQVSQSSLPVALIK